MRRLITVTAALCALGCSSSKTSITLSAAGGDPAASAAPADPMPPADTAFEAVAEGILDAHLAANPTRAVALGLHAHDGKLPDVSSAGVAKDRERLKTAIAALAAHDPGRLSAVHAAERDALLTALQGDLFERESLRAPARNPMFYMDPLALTPYVSLAYAPVPRRAQGIVGIAKATTAYLEHAKSNLEEALPLPWIETALLQARGNAEFARKDARDAMKGLPEDAASELSTALDEMATALDDYATFLEGRREGATQDYALGAETFSAMLARTQGVDVDLARLERVLQDDLARNLAAMKQAAKQIDAKAKTTVVVRRVANEKPAAGKVLQTATTQSDDMKNFVVDHDLVSIPTDDPVEVVESPPFMRWNAAFLGGAGPFETEALPNFYYISPPDPKWSKKKQREYIPGEADLLFITIHEVWPGHFLHGLHVKANESRILKALWNYATGEGWAHYVEEMMWNEGVSDDPRIHVGQLQNALLRNVRAISAIGLHTKGMTVAESKRLFIEQAFQDEANAEQQAVRGTFDPMYLSYTVGKLAIMKMRDDLAARDGDAFSLHEFHDALLAYGAAPLSAIRRALLGDDALL